jgi:hypothetical protein
MKIRHLLLVGLVLLGSCRAVGFAPMYLVNELAPNGTLRAAINFGNTVLAQKDPKTGEARGVSVDLARELAVAARRCRSTSCRTTPPARCRRRDEATAGTSHFSPSTRSAPRTSPSPRRT